MKAKWITETIGERMGHMVATVHYVKRTDGLYLYQATSKPDAETLAAALNQLTDEQWARALGVDNG